MFILYEVANETVECALVLRIDVHLTEDFVDCVNGLHGLRIRIGHALDRYGVCGAIGIHREQILHHLLRETVM